MAYHQILSRQERMYGFVLNGAWNGSKFYHNGHVFEMIKNLSRGLNVGFIKAQ